MKSYCISHTKDVDGLASAAMVVAARGGEFRLTDYDDLMNELDSVPKDAEEFILCDLGTDPGRVGLLVKKLEAISKRSKVTYIDHHYLSEDAKRSIRSSGVTLRHSVNECSGVLTYREFEAELPRDAKLLALYSAVTDYMDDSRIAKRLMERYDRQFVLFEATLLALAIAKRGKDHQFLRFLVRELSSMKVPHSISGVPTAALEQAKKLDELSKLVSVRSGVNGKIAYIETAQYSTGNVAKLLLSAHDVPLGVAYREKPTRGWYEVSLRGTSGVGVHLGKVVGEIAGRYGGSGGGHKVAAGCSIPKDRITDLLAELNRQL